MIAPLNSIIEDQFTDLSSKGYRAATLSSLKPDNLKDLQVDIILGSAAVASLPASSHNATLGIILHNLFTSNKEIRLLVHGNSRPPVAACLKNKPRLVPVCWQAFSPPSPLPIPLAARFAHRLVFAASPLVSPFSTDQNAELRRLV